MVIREVEHGMQTLANQVYVMPENKVMTIADGILLPTDRNRSVKTNQAIKMFFESLAADKVFKAIAIVLSGYGSDGTDGIKAVKKSGGWVITQDMLDHGMESMPNSVIATGLADLVLKTRDMPGAIIELGAQISDDVRLSCT